jgi:hypothetical protein
MNKVFKKISLIVAIIFATSQVALAQAAAPDNEVNFIDSFYSSGKIMVVVAGLGTVLAILVIYLIRLERKLNKIEKEK